LINDFEPQVSQLSQQVNITLMKIIAESPAIENIIHFESFLPIFCQALKVPFLIKSPLKEIKVMLLQWIQNFDSIPNLKFYQYF
jgi:hypothetical protein